MTLLQLAGGSSGCGGSSTAHPDRIRTACERYAFAEDHSALAYLSGDRLYVRRASAPPALRKLERPQCMVEMVDRLALSPSGETVAAYGVAEGSSRPRCFFDVAEGRTWEPQLDGLLAWIGSEPVMIPDDKLPMPRAMCRAFATKEGPVVACLDEGRPGDTSPVADGASAIKVKRFRGRELAAWGDELSVPVHRAGIDDRKRMKIGWDGRMVTWIAGAVRLVELGERDVKVRELGQQEQLVEPSFGELRSVELEPNGRRLMLVTWQSDDRFPQPLGHLRILGEDGQIQRTISANGQALEGFWEEPAAVWLMHTCGGDRIPLPANDQEAIAVPP